MEIRRAIPSDLPRLLELYTHLHGNAYPPVDDGLRRLWDEILSDKNHHVILGFAGGDAVSSCVLVIVPNLTRNQRPYALIENVITHPAHRNQGYASRLLDEAYSVAKSRDCYKIMLMTGSKEESTLSFYENRGYNRHDKTAFVQWLD